MTRHDAEVHEALVRSRNLLDHEGWTCNTLGRKGYPKCAMGAVKAALGNTGIVKDQRAHVVAATLCRANDLGGSHAPTYNGAVNTVESWNDSPIRTVEEVLAAFDRAINATAPPPHDPLNDMDPTSDTRVEELVR